ncbi:MAG: hypothetical protein ABI333_26945 [bacterium]
MRQTKHQRELETARARKFHGQVKIGIIVGFSLLFVTAVVLTMVTG